MQKLDSRLAACAAYLQQGKTVADVGCDHGKLTAYLAQNGFSVIGTDINEKPLEKARQTCLAANCMDKVSLRQGDGLDTLAPMEAQQIVIAGVSAETILHILDSASWVQTKGIRLVLCPATKLPLLRKELCSRGFELLDETPVLAAGRCYSVLCVEYTGIVTRPNGEFCLIGKSESKPYSKQLWDDTAIKLEKQLRGLVGTPQEPEVRRLLQWLKDLSLTK